MFHGSLYILLLICTNSELKRPFDILTEITFLDDEASLKVIECFPPLF